MRQTGQLTQWDDAKGYGFITPDGGGAKLFVHIQAFSLRPHRPFLGERLSYTPGRDAQGKARAVDVQSREPKLPSKPEPAHRDHSRVLLLIPAFALVVLACQLRWGLPRPLWGVYIALSLASFIVYWDDKRSARRRSARVPENVLQLLSLLGGWPGALLAQQLLRHKTAKLAFLRVYWATVVLNIAAFFALFTPLLR